MESSHASTPSSCCGRRRGWRGRRRAWGWATGEGEAVVGGGGVVEEGCEEEIRGRDASDGGNDGIELELELDEEGFGAPIAAAEAEIITD